MPTQENILVRGVNWLGDAVMTTPALQRLRAARPGARITLLTPEKLADLWRGHPALDAVLTLAAGEGVFTVARRLRAEEFTTAVVFPNSLRTGLEVFLARIPRRIGRARNGRSLLLTDALPPRAGAVAMHKRSESEIRRRLANNEARETFPASTHHTLDYLELVSMLGADPTPLPPLLCVNDEAVMAFKKRFGLDGEAPVFGLNAGAEYGPAKRWPRERFVEAAQQLHQATGCRWLLLGGPADRELTAELKRTLVPAIGERQVVDVAGQTSLLELCAALKACAIVLTNDTGPMHVAAAVGTPVVVPFGSTSPELTGPLGGRDTQHELLCGPAACAPCFLRECPVDFRCLKGIEVGQVTEAALRAWKGRAGH